MASGATLAYNNNNTIQTLNSSGHLLGFLNTLTASQYNLNDGAVVDGKLGFGTVNSNGAVSINALLAATTINIQTGILTLGAADILSHDATVDIALNARMILEGGDQTILNLTGSGQVFEEHNYVLHVTNGGSYNGDVSSLGSLIKTGTGSLTLSGSSAFDQGATVQNGSLVVNGIVTTEIIVDVDGTLKGRGVVNGNVTNYGITAPGNSPGVLTINGNYHENGTLQIEIGGNAGPGVNPNGWDQVAVTGVTTLNPTTSVLQIQQYNGFTPTKGDTYMIINGAPG